MSMVIDQAKLALLIERLHKTASQKTWEDGLGADDEFNPMDWSGGNFDDAYEGGKNTGETECARDLLDLLGLPWKQPDPDADEDE